MATFQNTTLVQNIKHTAFDQTYVPGATTPFSGIYRCDNCGDEVASNKGNPLPPQNHKQHTPAKGAIVWRLLVYAETK